MAPFAMFDMLSDGVVREPGQDPRDAEYIDVAEVSGGWLEATNTGVLRGRLFTSAELAAPPTVALLDEEAVRELWGGEAVDPIGRTLQIGDSAPSLVTVVGVIPTRQEMAFRQPEAQIGRASGRDRPCGAGVC